MKKLFVLFTFCCLFSFAGNTQVEKIRDRAAKAEIVSLQEKTTEIDTLGAKVQNLSEVIASLPDSFLMVLGQDSFWFPIKDGVVIVSEVKGFVDDNKGNWPNSLPAWIGLVVSLVVGGKFTQVFVSAKNIYNFLKPMLKNTLFIVALFAAIVSAGITLLFGNGAFDYTMFSAVSGW